MQLPPQEIKNILKKIDNKTASKEEIEKFNAWYASFDDRITFVYEDIAEDLQNTIWQSIQARTKYTSIYQSVYFKVAATLLLISLFSFLFYNYQKDSKVATYPDAILVEGKDMKDLVLYSSASDFLDSTKYLNLSEVVSNEPIHKITTGKGQFIKIKLSDGTKVSLSSGSQISLSEDFNNAINRTVYLIGEAYFEVNKIEGSTFTVVAKNQRVEVLGTKFNIKAYAHQNEVVTSLLEGSIRLDNGKELKTLVPNDIAITNVDKIEIKKEPIVPSVGWRSLHFEFDNETIEDVMLRLSYWYGVDVKFTNTVPKLRISGKIPRGTSLTDLQTILHNLTQGDYILKKNELQITFNNN